MNDFQDLHEFRDLLRTFTTAAIKYKERHGKVPALVVDNANRLAENEPELLDNLQDAAKVATRLNGISQNTFRSKQSHLFANVARACEGWDFQIFPGQLHRQGSDCEDFVPDAGGGHK